MDTNKRKIKKEKVDADKGDGKNGDRCKFNSVVINNIKNRSIRRREVHKMLVKKAKEKKADRKKRRKAGEKPQVPHTIESLRVKDETVLDPDIIENEEKIEESNVDIRTDEFESYFSCDYEPKVLITFNDNPTKKTRTFGIELCRMIPNSLSRYRSRSNLKTVVEHAKQRNFSDIVLINEDKREPNGLLVIHLPNGPTAYFRMSNVKLTSDLKKTHKEITSHRPEVILNNFTTRLGTSIARMLASLFHYDPNFKGRRVVTFHNQRDYIFFRHHRYNNTQKSRLVGVLDSSVASVDEFVPDGGVLDKSFLEDNSPPPKQVVPASSKVNQDSDSELSDGGNPLVSGYQDDLDPDDSLHSIPNLPVFQDSTPSQGEAKEINTSEWVSRLEDRGSPEGGEDSQDNLDNSVIVADDVDNNNPCTVIKNNSAKNKDVKSFSKSKQKHKKKASLKEKDKEKEDTEIKDEKRKRKKSTKKNGGDHNATQMNELEDFLNSHDASYEAI